MILLLLLLLLLFNPHLSICSLIIKKGRKLEGMGRERRERERVRERLRQGQRHRCEKHLLVASHTHPKQGLNLQPRYVP